MKILITGIAGFIGSRLASWILNNVEDSEVFGIDNLSGGFIENVPKEAKLFVCDLSDNIKVIDVFNEVKPDYVYHLAAYAAEGLSPFIRTFNYNNNLIATANVINECIRHDVKRLVFTSSMAVYGHGFGNIFDETQTPSPIDPYGIAKYACEMDIKVAGEQHGLDWCIIRPHNFYGINQNIWDKYRNVLGIWMNQALNKKPMLIYGDGSQTRAFSYVDDSLEPLWNAAIKPQASKEIINLGGIKEFTIFEANTILRNLIDYDNVLFLENRHEVKYAVPTYQKSIDILDYKYKTELDDGLFVMWLWALTQPNRDQFIWKDYELDKGIYSFWK